MAASSRSNAATALSALVSTSVWLSGSGTIPAAQFVRQEKPATYSSDCRSSVTFLQMHAPGCVNHTGFVHPGESKFAAVPWNYPLWEIGKLGIRDALFREFSWTNELNFEPRTIAVFAPQSRKRSPAGLTQRRPVAQRVVSSLLPSHPDAQFHAVATKASWSPVSDRRCGCAAWS